MVEKMLPEGAEIAVGGSVTLQKTGILDLIKSPKYKFKNIRGIGFLHRKPRETPQKIVEKHVFLYEYVYNIQINIWHSFCLYIMACLV